MHARWCSVFDSIGLQGIGWKKRTPCLWKRWSVPTTSIIKFQCLLCFSIWQAVIKSKTVYRGTYYIFFEIYQFLFTWYGCGFGVWYELLILSPVILAFLSRAPSVRFSYHVRSNHASQVIWNSCIVYNGVHGCFTAGKLFKRKFFVRTLFKIWVKKFNIWWCSDFKPLLLVFQFRWQ